METRHLAKTGGSTGSSRKCTEKPSLRHFPENRDGQKADFAGLLAHGRATQPLRAPQVRSDGGTAEPVDLTTFGLGGLLLFSTLIAMSFLNPAIRPSKIDDEFTRFRDCDPAISTPSRPFAAEGL